MSEPTFCSGVADIAARYDGFIIDQWGVLHDGGAPYAGALSCLEALRERDKRVVLLSNTGRRRAANLEQLQALGIGRALFDDVVTSGETAWQALKDRMNPFFAALGRRCLLWAHEGDLGAVADLSLELAGSAADADFILLTGTDAGAAYEHYEADLDLARARDLPMVCTNPDLVAVGPEGFGLGPGALARRYEEQGGRVAYIGKPHAPVFRRCLDLLAELPRERVVVIGDSLEHDIRGGAAAGLDTVLVMGGIHIDAFDLERGRNANGAVLERLAREHQAVPRWVLPRFRWRGG